MLLLVLNFSERDTELVLVTALLVIHFVHAWQIELMSASYRQYVLHNLSDNWLHIARIQRLMYP